jgi:hypothetical protein
MNRLTRNLSIATRKTQLTVFFQFSDWLHGEPSIYQPELYIIQGHQL